MKHLLKKLIRTSIFCTGLLFFAGIMVEAGDIESMENQSSNLKSELDSVNKELLDIGNDIADAEEKIEETKAKYDFKYTKQLAKVTTEEKLLHKAMIYDKNMNIDIYK